MRLASASMHLLRMAAAQPASALPLPSTPQAPAPPSTSRRPARPRCSVWEGPYSAEEAMAWQLGMLRDYIADPSDWVVAADVDELQDWGGKFLK